MNKSAAINLLARHALASMPENEHEKIQLYNAIAAALPKCPERDAAAHIAATLSTVRRLQYDFLKTLGIETE